MARTPKGRKRPASHKRPKRSTRRRSSGTPSPQPFERKLDKIDPASVILKPGKGTGRTGGGPGGRYWHVYVGNQRAGRAYINWHASGEELPHASITLELNIAFRGRGIGSFAFRRASELSGYNEVFATLRKENIASRHALERAGFVADPSWSGLQLRLVWRRS